MVYGLRTCIVFIVSMYATLGKTLKLEEAAYISPVDIFQHGTEHTRQNQQAQEPSNRAPLLFTPNYVAHLGDRMTPLAPALPLVYACAGPSHNAGRGGGDITKPSKQKMVV